MALEFQKPLSPRERQARNRREMTEAILSAARVIMRREGVAALNLHEIARMVGVQTSALYKYFPGKAAIYDELYRRGMQLIYDRLEAVYQTHPPSWERLEAWAHARAAFAQENPDLEHILFGRDVPGFVPSEESMALSRARLESARRAMQEVVDAGVIAPDMPLERALDLFLAVSSGITNQHLANEPHLPVGEGRFGGLIPDAIRLFQAAWSPTGKGSHDSASPGVRREDEPSTYSTGGSDHAADPSGNRPE